jgi:hypothetical protein
MSLSKAIPSIIIFCSGFIFLQCSSDGGTKTVPAVATKPKPSATKVPTQPPPSPFKYQFFRLRGKDKDSALARFKAYSPEERDIILRLNRVDAASYRRLDTMILPEPVNTDWMAYAVFPKELPILKDVNKMVFFAYYPEAFAAYEHGKLVKWGPASMGKKSTPTPTGLFSANWKAKETTSTVNDEWKLKWNFNVSNKGGVGWHQYQLPGYPASHSCMRLYENDALFLYSWAEQWILSNHLLAAQGTPVIIFGEYPFGHPKPWWSLVKDPNALNISEETMNALIEPNLPKIMKRQAQRDSVISRMPAKPIDTASRNT